MMRTFWVVFVSINMLQRLFLPQDSLLSAELCDARGRLEIWRSKMYINAISTIALIVLAGCALPFLAQMMGSSPQQA
jgi:hypothetical protein